ncbi:MAG: GTPase HflX [Paludibacteraceae bacterium]|nr:GTPase HflX [Paludibacteraceae bacterium]
MSQAILIGLITPSQPEEKTNEYLDELAFLAETNDITPTKRFIQRINQPDTNTYVGSGKIQEIKQFIELNKDTDKHIDLVIFDDELSPRQLRNIEKELQIQIMDRTILILEIFLKRAQTSYAKTQVEVAHLQYMLPRLTRMWTHLDRQRGGGNTSRGMGETQIEADKRIINSRIALLKEELKKIDRQMATQRQNRGKLVRVALVGYTNVGKSTLMNLISKSDVFAENKLFATLDTTVRKVTIDNLPFLLSDTVGFIRKLPHNLIESFKSTLDEVREADLLIHVVDISHPNFEEQFQVVEKTIAQICSQNTIPQIVVFNKIDAFTYTPKEQDDLTPLTKQNLSLQDLQKTWMARLNDNCIFISAKSKIGIEQLKQVMYDKIKEIHIQRYPYNDFLFQKYE